MLTKLEAKIQQDYNTAIARKRKDELSKRYMSLCKKFRGRIRGYNEPLEKICKEVALDDILDEIKLSFKDTHPDFSKHCSVLKGYFKFRHWYAHGRYFRTPAVPVPRELQQLCDEFNILVFSRI